MVEGKVVWEQKGFVTEDMKENKLGKEKTIQKNSRMSNLELLRCLAMMMVVVLHYLDKGKILSDLTVEIPKSTKTVAWALESFCIVAVNTYMLISGYFLSTSDFKLSRLIKLYLQLWVYSVGIGVLGIATGLMPLSKVEIHDLLTLVLPVSMGHYWFVTAYIFMYLFLPFIGDGIKKMTKKQMQVAIGLLLLFFCVLKSVLPVRLEMDGQGYDCVWYLCVFLTAAYIRRFGSKFVSGLKKSICLYIFACLAIFGLTMGLQWVYETTGSLGRIAKIGLEYNHILPYMASVGLFGTFLYVKVPEKIGVIINRIAPYTLGVYLWHENLTMRYAWQNRLGANRVSSIGSLLLWTLVAVLTVFATGILVDMLRAALMKGLHGLFSKVGVYRKLVTTIENVDAMFVDEE